MANGCANVHGINANGFHGFYFGINFIKSYAYTIVHSVLCCDVQCAHTHSWWKVSSTKCYSAQGESSQQQRKRDFTVSCNKPHIFCSMLNYQYSFVYLSPIKNHLQSTLYMRHVEKVIVRSFPRNNFLAIPSYIVIYPFCQLKYGTRENNNQLIEYIRHFIQTDPFSELYSKFMNKIILWKTHKISRLKIQKPLTLQLLGISCQ